MDVMTDLRNRVERYTPLTSTYCTIGSQVELWGLNETTATSNDETVTDELAGTVTRHVLDLVKQLNSYVLLCQKRGKAQPGRSFYTTTKTWNVKGKTVRVKLTFDTFVNLPAAVLAIFADKLLTDLTNTVMPTLDPEGTEEFLVDIMQEAAARIQEMLSQLFFSAGYAYYGGHEHV